jgi:hypothetical protein
MKQPIALFLLLGLGAPALAQTDAQQAWGEACSESLGRALEGPGVEAGSEKARARGGAITTEHVRVQLAGLTITRHVCASEREAAKLHRARAAWETDEPTVAQVRGHQLVVISGPDAAANAQALAEVLRAAWSGEAQPEPGPPLELSLSRPWRDAEPNLTGVNRVAFSRLAGAAHSGTYHADVTLAVRRARQGEAEFAHFMDVPLRNHLVQPDGDDALQEFRLGADGVALHADARDAAAAKGVWEALKALLAALDDPGFAPARETVGPAGGAADGGRRPGPPIDGALGD